jgi:hypothetical protein
MFQNLTIWVKHLKIKIRKELIMKILLTIQFKNCNLKHLNSVSTITKRTSRINFNIILQSTSMSKYFPFHDISLQIFSVHL